MKLSLSIDDELAAKVRRKAEAMGTSVNQLVHEYLENFAGKPDLAADAEEFERLSQLSKGDSHGWKFNREEAHARGKAGIFRDSQGGSSVSQRKLRSARWRL